MSLLLTAAAPRVYDALKSRPGAASRESGARDARLLAAIGRRMNELIGVYRLNTQQERGHTYVFWSELSRLVSDGAFDDLLDGL